NDTRISGDGFKYYDWNDANNDGVFDNGEQVEYLISAANAATKQKFANWFTYYRKREYVAKALTSNVIADNSSSRVGFATINQNAGVGLRVALQNQSFLTGNKRTLLDALFSANSSGSSPLRTSFEKVGKYFNCVAGDIFNSAGASSPGSANCPALIAPGGECQVNTAFVVTDGFDNDSASPSVGNADGDNDTNFDGGAFADGFSNTLADIAMYYYENDIQGSLDNNVSLTSFDFSRDPNSPAFLQVGDSLHQHLNTNIVGIFNSSNIDTSFPSDSTSLEAWVDPNPPNPTLPTFLGKVDDLRHTAFNGRGNLISTFSGKDFPSIMNELSTAFSRATSNSGSTTVMAFNTQSITQDTLVFRTFSDLTTNAGELAAQRVNPDGSFAVDLNGNPDFVWSAATALDSQSAASRLILTYEPVSNNGRQFVITGSPATSGLTMAQQAELSNPVPANPANPIVPTRVNYLRGSTTNEGANFNNGDMRVRQFSTANGITTGGKLGDIVHSSPVFVGEPPFASRSGGEYPSAVGETYLEFRAANTNRQELVYVGANDGMLHGFIADPLSSSKGQEKLAYVPNILLSELGEFTNPDYSHRFYVDSTPSVNDVFIDPNPPSTNSHEWRTVLVNGLGAGGKGYFALDITNPASINTDSVLWEFTDSDDVDLGFTYSQPVIGMSNITDSGSNEKRWIAVFGNGFNSSSVNGEAVIYILFIDEGYDGWGDPGDFIKINTGKGISSSADGTTPNGIGGVTGTDTDGNGTVDRLYAGDLQGNVYVVDISDPSSSNWGIASTL
ncbi:MAG: PilC/PilY family type IV pilus protein, partial [Gammaproteobacteria bacterium]